MESPGSLPCGVTQPRAKGGGTLDWTGCDRLGWACVNLGDTLIIPGNRAMVLEIRDSLFRYQGKMYSKRELERMASNFRSHVEMKSTQFFIESNLIELALV